jgi:hypothetical protein
MININNPFIKPLIEYPFEIINEFESIKNELHFFKNTPRYIELLKIIIDNWSSILNDKMKKEIENEMII